MIQCPALPNTPRYEKAAELARCRRKLLHRLLDAKSVLKDSYRQYFHRWEFDFEKKCLISQNGQYALLWLNAETTNGIVVCIELPKEKAA